MRYFYEVPLWKLALLNLIVGLCMSPGFTVAWFFMTPLCIWNSCGAMTIWNYVIGISILVAIIFIWYIANAKMWKRYKKNNALQTSNYKMIEALSGLVGSVFAFALGIFAIYFILLILSSMM